MSSQPMTIFTRAYDFLTWLIPRTMDFPRSQRFVVTRRLQDAALDFQERIIEANRRRGQQRLDQLRQADAALDKVRLYLRLVARWQWLNPGQYHHVSQMVKELGDLLGGWIKQSSGTSGSSA
jgi:four helix bundle protein